MSGFLSSLTGKSASSSSSSVNQVQQREPPAATNKVLTSPAEGAVPKRRFEYTEEQLHKIEELRKYSSTLLLPKDDPYYPWEARFLADPGCHPRYCRAGKWRLDEAKRRIKGTIEWRREFKPELIEPSDVGPEAHTGKIVLTGFDVDARPILYMRPGRENTDTPPRQIRHMVYHLERAIDFCPPGQDQVTIIIDYKSATSQTNPSLGKARIALNILQNHYVERLGRGLVVNMPWWINAFYTALSPFLDPITREKIRFNPKLLDLVPQSHLDWEFGGDYNFKFEFEPYWKSLQEFCQVADDGSRVDKDGKSWVPPLGNGAKAAAEGIVPNEGAIESGDMKNAEGEVLPNPLSSTATSTLVGDVTEDAKIGTVVGKTTTRTSQKSEAQKIAENHRTSLEGDEAARKLAVLNFEERQATPEPPNKETQPGKPIGDAKFDHEPSKAELEKVQA